MSNFQEYGIYLAEFLEYILGYGLISNFGSSVVGIAAYVLSALSLYTIATRRGIKNPWLSWIPVVNCWIVGSLSDQYRYVVKGQVKNKRKTLLILNIISAVVALILVIAGLVMAVQTATSFFGMSMTGSWRPEFLDTAMGMVAAALAMAVPILGLRIAIKVVRFMALYDIYTSCSPQNNVVYLVLSIIIGITEPLFLFLCRDKDEGMPPRKQEPVPPPPQEPWNNPETLYKTPSDENRRVFFCLAQVLSSVRFCDKLLRSGSCFRRRRGCCGFGHFEALNLAFGGGVRHIAAHDLLFVDQDGGVDRIGGAGVIADLVYIAHGIFAGQFAQIIPLAFLELVVPVENFRYLLRNPDLAGLHRRIFNFPAEILEKFHPGIVAGEGRGRGCLGVGAADGHDHCDDDGGNGSQKNERFLHIDLSGHNHHSNPSQLRWLLHYSLFCIREW